MKTEEAICLVMNIIAAAEEKHPVWPPDPVMGAALVARESGELLKAALSPDGKNLPQYAAAREAAHTAAAAIRFLKNCNTEKKNE